MKVLSDCIPNLLLNVFSRLIVVHWHIDQSREMQLNSFRLYKKKKETKPSILAHAQIICASGTDCAATTNMN